MNDNRPLELTIADIGPRTGPSWHAPQCHCADCSPPHPGDDAGELTGNQKALLVLSGLAVGEAICFVLDRIVSGPGVLAMFGL